MCYMLRMMKIGQDWTENVLFICWIQCTGYYSLLNRLQFMCLTFFFFNFFTAWTEEQVVSLQQAVLCHWWSAIPDYRKRFGVFSADLPAGCGSGELLTILSHPSGWSVLPLLYRPIYSCLGTLKEHQNWELSTFQLVNEPSCVLKSLLSGWGTRKTWTPIITCDNGGNLYRELETLCVFSIIGSLLRQCCIRRGRGFSAGTVRRRGAHFNWLWH